MCSEGRGHEIRAASSKSRHKPDEGYISARNTVGEACVVEWHEGTFENIFFYRDCRIK